MAEAGAADSKVFQSKYTKIGVIGKGSFGEALLARSKENGIRYVVKAIDTNGMSTKELNDVRNEIGIIATVNHPNIVHYHEHFQDGTCIYIVMEYADAGDLSCRVKERRKDNPTNFFDPKLVIEWFMQIAMALQYLHSKHILHRDLKSANVFLTSRNVVKLGDFGISTVLRNTMACAKTVCGTPYYFSPEICQGRPYNNKSDIWSLGILLYEMLSLHRPFNAKSLKELLGKILAGQYEPLPKTIPQDIRTMSTMLLQPSPTKRPSIAGLFEFPFLKSSLQTYSVELQAIIKKDKHYGTKSKPKAIPSAPTEPAKAPAAGAGKSDISQIRRMNREDVKSMLETNSAQFQAELEAQKLAKAAGRKGDVGEEQFDDTRVLYEQQLAVSEQVGVLAHAGVQGGDEEFGDPGSASEATMVSLGNGQAVPIGEVRSALEAVLGAKLLGRALEYVSNVTGAPQEDVQRELHSLLGVSFSQYSNAVTRLAMWEGAH